MCLKQEDKDRLQAKIDNQEAFVTGDWYTLKVATHTCEFEAQDPYFDGQWVIEITCRKCGASFSGLGGEDDEIEAFLDTDPE